MDLKKVGKWMLIVSIIICLIAIIIIVALLNKSKQPILNQIQGEDIEKEEIHYDIIQFTKYNEIENAYISDMQMCNIYLLDYKSNMLKHTKQAYNTLDEKYREKRFGSFENYKNYIQENVNNILDIKLAKYQVNRYDGYNQYMCIDQFGNYYIFHETAIMKYTTILDTYTIDLPQYKETYNTSNQTQKVGMCVDRFMKAINDENYTFAYSLLSSGFKNNYFETQEKFATYAKQNLTKREQVAYQSIESEGDIYMYKVMLGSSDTAVKTIEKTFIVKLGEGTNFEISFNI